MFLVSDPGCALVQAGVEARLSRLRASMLRSGGHRESAGMGDPKRQIESRGVSSDALGATIRQSGRLSAANPIPPESFLAPSFISQRRTGDHVRFLWFESTEGAPSRPAAAPNRRRTKSASRFSCTRRSTRPVSAGIATHSVAGASCISREMSLLLTSNVRVRNSTDLPPVSLSP